LSCLSLPYPILHTTPSTVTRPHTVHVRVYPFGRFAATLLLRRASFSTLLARYRSFAPKTTRNISFHSFSTGDSPIWKEHFVSGPTPYCTSSDAGCAILCATPKPYYSSAVLVDARQGFNYTAFSNNAPTFSQGPKKSMKLYNNV
jgi:hypothetical protein